MPGLPVPMKRWTRVEYERLVDCGIFEPSDRIELIDGLLLVSEPQSSPHYTSIQLVQQALARAFGEGWTVRSQAPIALDDASEPEPDVAVVRGGIRDFAAAHPVDPVLVVEVSLSSLAFDREHKASLYARAGRPEYWIVNLVDRVIEVRREPAPEPSAPYGWDYAFVDVLGPTERVSALGAPAVQIPVGDLLP
jgi:Uma2 family endonuclease